LLLNIITPVKSYSPIKYVCISSGRQAFSIKVISYSKCIILSPLYLLENGFHCIRIQTLEEIISVLNALLECQWLGSSWKYLRDIDVRICKFLRINPTKDVQTYNVLRDTHPAMSISSISTTCKKPFIFISLQLEMTYSIVVHTTPTKCTLLMWPLILILFIISLTDLVYGGRGRDLTLTSPV